MHEFVNDEKMFDLDTIKNMENDCTHLKRQIELLRLDLERLNKLIYKETTSLTTLERNNLLSEGDFVRELKVRSLIRFDFPTDEIFRTRKKMRYIWKDNW